MNNFKRNYIAARRAIKNAYFVRKKKWSLVRKEIPVMSKMLLIILQTYLTTCLLRSLAFLYSSRCLIFIKGPLKTHVFFSHIFYRVFQIFEKFRPPPLNNPPPLAYYTLRNFPTPPAIKTPLLLST